MIPKMFSHLNKKHLLATIFSVFAFIWVSDFIIHGTLLKNAYMETANLWRTPEEMQSHMIWMLMGQFFMATFFSIIFMMGYEGKGPKEGMRFGLLMGLFMWAPLFIQYAVTPIPQSLIFSWMFFGLIQSILAGLVASITCKKCSTHCHAHSKAA